MKIVLGQPQGLVLRIRCNVRLMPSLRSDRQLAIQYERQGEKKRDGVFWRQMGLLSEITDRLRNEFPVLARSVE